MNLFWHLLTHFSLSVFAGLMVGIWQGDLLLMIFAALLGGFFIDIDHLIDYFLAFGAEFRLKWFGEGRQFLQTDKIFILFHGWEYVIILVTCSFLMSGLLKAATIAFYLSLFIHLIADCFINYGVRPKSYFLLYRIYQNFQVKKLVTQKHWEKHQKQKQQLLK